MCVLLTPATNFGFDRQPIFQSSLHSPATPLPNPQSHVSALCWNKIAGLLLNQQNNGDCRVMLNSSDMMHAQCRKIKNAVAVKNAAVKQMITVLYMAHKGSISESYTATPNVGANECAKLMKCTETCTTLTETMHSNSTKVGPTESEHNEALQHWDIYMPEYAWVHTGLDFLMKLWERQETIGVCRVHQRGGGWSKVHRSSPLPTKSMYGTGFAPPPLLGDWGGNHPHCPLPPLPRVQAYAGDMTAFFM